MPRSSGTYTPPSSSWYPAVSGNSAAFADWNTLLADISTAMTQSLSQDGQTSPTGNLPMAGYKHTGAANATASGQYLVWGQDITVGNLTASGVVSGAGFANFVNTQLLTPGPIGGTTPNGARFTFAHTAPAVVAFSATAMVIDCSLSNVFTTTFTANVTVAPTFANLKDGQTINWFITQDAGGSKSITGFWPSSFRWPGGVPGVLSTAGNSVDLVVATYRATPGLWYATLTKGFA